MIAAYAGVTFFMAIESFIENRLFCGAAVLPNVGSETTLFSEHKADERNTWKPSIKALRLAGHEMVAPRNIPNFHKAATKKRKIDIVFHNY